MKKSFINQTSLPKIKKSIEFNIKNRLTTQGNTIQSIFYKKSITSQISEIEKCLSLLKKHQDNNEPLTCQTITNVIQSLKMYKYYLNLNQQFSIHGQGNMIKKCSKLKLKTIATEADENQTRPDINIKGKQILGSQRLYNNFPADQPSRHQKLTQPNPNSQHFQKLKKYISIHNQGRLTFSNKNNTPKVVRKQQKQNEQIKCLKVNYFAFDNLNTSAMENQLKKSKSTTNHSQVLKSSFLQNKQKIPECPSKQSTKQKDRISIASIYQKCKVFSIQQHLQNLQNLQKQNRLSHQMFNDSQISQRTTNSVLINEKRNLLRQYKESEEKQEKIVQDYYEKIKNQMKKEIQELKQKLRQKDEEVEEMKSRIDQLNMNIDNLVKKNNKKTEELNVLNENFMEIKQKYEELQNTVLKNQNKQQYHLQTSTKNIPSLQQLFQNSPSHLKTCLKTKNQTISHLKKELKQIKKELKQKSQQLQNYQQTSNNQTKIKKDLYRYQTAQHFYQLVKNDLNQQNQYLSNLLKDRQNQLVNIYRVIERQQSTLLMNNIQKSQQNFNNNEIQLQIEN